VNVRFFFLLMNAFATKMQETSDKTSKAAANKKTKAGGNNLGCLMYNYDYESSGGVITLPRLFNSPF
jgi:hypothetical protein